MGDVTQIVRPAAGAPITPTAITSGAPPAPSTVRITPSAQVAGMPSIFAQLGFVPTGAARKRLFLTSEGPTGAGKTHFIRTMPGPIALIDFDRGSEGVLERDIYGNPIMRKSLEFAEFDEGGKTMTLAEHEQAKQTYQTFKYLVERLVSSGEVRTLAIDTGGAAYSLAQAARFGRIAQVGEVPPALWTAMQAEYENIFLQAYDYGCNVIVTHRQGSKFKGLSGEKELKGYKQMEFLGQVHLVHQKKVVKVPHPTLAGLQVDQVELSIKVKKCRQRIALDGYEFPIVMLGEDEKGVMQSIGGRFVDVAQAVFPMTQESDWI